MSTESRARHGPRISFGIIVLNGEPFIGHVLRALYPFAHEIIVVEGAVPGAVALATSDGHSRDRTRDTLQHFKGAEDPEGKLIVITRDGFWDEKDDQSRAYAERVTGDYLWQVDVDEFYLPQDMHAVIELLRSDPDISAISFPQRTFWGGFEYIADGWYLRRQFTQVHRVFKWGPGYRYASHRPPTVVDEKGRGLRSLKWLDAGEMARRGIFMFHYSLLLPQQVAEKCRYYAAADWAKRDGAIRWADMAYASLRWPFRVHNVYDHPSWLERYDGPHPPEANALRAELAGTSALRDTHDIDRLLASPLYRLGRMLLRAAAATPVTRALARFVWSPKSALSALRQLRTTSAAESM